MHSKSKLQNLNFFYLIETFDGVLDKKSLHRLTGNYFRFDLRITLGLMGDHFGAVLKSSFGAGMREI